MSSVGEGDAFGNHRGMDMIHYPIEGYRQDKIR